MKKYYLISKYSKEVINSFSCMDLDSAISYFSKVKKLKKQDLLNIFDIKE